MVANSSQITLSNFVGVEGVEPPASSASCRFSQSTCIARCKQNRCSQRLSAPRLTASDTRR